MHGRMLSRQSFVAEKTVVTSSATTVQLVDANPSRVGLSIFNDSTAILSLAATDDATEIDTKGADINIAAGGYFEVPGNWCGPIYGKWASVNGNARIKEYK